MVDKENIKLFFSVDELEGMSSLKERITHLASRVNSASVFCVVR